MCLQLLLGCHRPPCSVCKGGRMHLSSSANLTSEDAAEPSVNRLHVPPALPGCTRSICNVCRLATNCFICVRGRLQPCGWLLQCLSGCVQLPWWSLQHKQVKRHFSQSMSAIWLMLPFRGQAVAAGLSAPARLTSLTAVSVEPALCTVTCVSPICMADAAKTGQTALPDSRGL